MTTTPHDGRCKCDACVTGPTPTALTKAQRQTANAYEGKIAVATTARDAAQLVYDQAAAARKTALDHKMRTASTAYAPLRFDEDRDLLEAYTDARDNLEKAIARVTTLQLQRDAAINQAGLQLAEFK